MTHTPTSIAAAIQKYITAQSEPVSRTYIMERSMSRGNSKYDTLLALEKLHRVRSIKMLNRKEDSWYQYCEPNAKAVNISWRLPRDMIPVMDSTNDGQHEIFDSMDFHRLFMSPDEIQNEMRKEERAFVNSLE